jgi:hypothetical protein
MASQAATEGRYLGGRPPYGYRLADAGPQPYPSEAADGWRLRRLEPDPITAPVVSRIYREFLAGSGIHAIAERLSRGGILSPSARLPAVRAALLRPVRAPHDRQLQQPRGQAGSRSAELRPGERIACPRSVALF